MRRRSFLMAALRARAPSVPVVIDTDMGSDDILAIAFLLARPEVDIEAITIVNGLAHVPAGASNASRLVRASGRSIPVFAGRTAPLQFTAPFPPAWRMISDRPLDHLREGASLQKQNAVDYLRARLSSPKPFRILALGPLTNLASALAADRPATSGLRELIAMGGAVRVAGNLRQGTDFAGANNTAEWNFFADPAAADKVLRSGWPCTLVPLDATNQAPIGPAFIQEFGKRAAGPLAEAVRRTLEANAASAKAGEFFAWDPLAAASLIDARLLKTEMLRLSVRTHGANLGQVRESPDGAPVRVAVQADAKRFESLFLATFQPTRRGTSRQEQRPPNTK